MIKSKTNNKWILSILILLLFCLTIPVGKTTSAKAESLANQELQTIIDNSYFITFKKGEDSTRGRYMVTCFYIPNEVYNPTYTYGAVIFPKLYGEKYGVTSDYINKIQEKGLSILDVVGTIKIEEENGYGINLGLAKILDNNVSLVFTFVLYAKDSNGNIAYATPQFAAYDTLDADELTLEELINKTNTVVAREDSFQEIVTKIEELTSTVWIYLLIAFGSVVVVWGSYIGIKIIIAKKNEEKINSRGMVKRLIIGIIVMAVIAVCCPLLISGLSHWILW